MKIDGVANSKGTMHWIEKKNYNCKIALSNTVLNIANDFILTAWIYIIRKAAAKNKFDNEKREWIQIKSDNQKGNLRYGRKIDENDAFVICV